jgi:hypothetical protein
VSDAGVYMEVPWRGSLVTAARVMLVVNELIIVLAVGAFVRSALTIGPATAATHVHGLHSGSYRCLTGGDNGTSTVICRHSDPSARVSTTYALRVGSLGSWNVSRPVFFLVILAALTMTSLVFGGWKAVRLAVGRGTHASGLWTWSWLSMYAAFGALCALFAAVIIAVT